MAEQVIEGSEKFLKKRIKNKMENLKNKKLALFFTKGISLEVWEKVGNLDREIKLYQKLASYFNEIYFFTYGDKEESKYQKLFPENIKIFSKKWNLSSSFYSLLLPLFYKEKIKEVDILKTNQMPGSWSAVIAKWLYKKKLVVRCGYEWLSFLEKQRKSWWKRIAAKFIEKIAYKNADKIILTSEKDKKFVIEKFKIAPEKIEVIPNYIDTDLFKPLNFPKEKNRVISVGRLEEQKNLFNLIEAAGTLSVKLVIIGTGSLKEKLKNFAKERNAKVEFKENIPNEKLPEELNRSEIFILPSWYEGCPKALLEAMACGLPCIGTNVEGIRDIIKHRENGYLCKPDAESIKKAILEVLNDKNLQQKISHNARKTILEKFSLEKILEKEIKIYQSL